MTSERFVVFLAQETSAKTAPLVAKKKVQGEEGKSMAHSKVATNDGITWYKERSTLHNLAEVTVFKVWFKNSALRFRRGFRGVV